MKIFILGNQAKALSNFWTILIKNLIAKEHEVICLVPNPRVPSSLATNATTSKKNPKSLQGSDDLIAENTLRSLGANILHYSLDRKGLNPFHDLHTVKDLKALFATEKPDILFASTIKPVIYGAVASALAGYPKRKDRHLMITGLGYMFEGGSIVKHTFTIIAKYLYQIAFFLSGTVYFQNNDDYKLFEKLSIITKNITVKQVKGTGVDLDRFSFAPPPQGKPTQFLMVARLLEAKGVQEFCEAAEMLSGKYPQQVEFCLLGPEESGAGAYPLEKVMAWEKKGCIRYLGATSDVRPFLIKASVVVLPSWREGAPCSLMEAMSTGRPVIAADAPGSKDVVDPNTTGLLVPVKEAKALAKAMELLLLDEKKREAMGTQARHHMEKEFNAQTIANDLIKSMNA